MNGRSFFKRIFKGYLLLILAVTLVFGTFFYALGYAQLKQDFASEMGEQIDRFAVKTDTSLRLIRSMTKYICNDEAISSYINGDSQDTGAVQREIDKNSVMRESGISMYISKLESSQDKVIGAEQTSRVYDFLNLYRLSSEGIKQYFEKSENEDKIFVRYCAQATARNTSGLIFVEKNTANAEAVYVIYFINSDTLISPVDYGGAAVAVLDGQSLVCNIGSNTTYTSKTIDETLKTNADFIKNGQSTFLDSYFYRVSESGVYKWSYILSVPTKGLSERATELLLYVLAIGFLWLAVSIGAAWLLCRWIYRPIKETVQFVSRYNDSDFFDEGVFVRQSVLKLHNETDELKEKIKTSEGELREKFLRDIVCGVTRDGETEEKIRRFSFDTSVSHRVVLISFANYRQMAENFPKENLQKIKDEIKAFIHERMGDRIEGDVFETDASSAALIVTGRDIRRIRETLADMAMMIQGNFDAETVCAIGTECDDMADISLSYKSAVGIMENRFSVGTRNAVVTEDDMKELSGESFFYPLDTERDLITSVIRGKKDEIHAIIDEIISENFERRTLTKDKVDALVFAVTATLNRIVEMTGKEADKVFGDGKIIFLDLKMCTDRFQLHEKMYEAFDAVSGLESAESYADDEKLSEKLLDYIHMHYNEDISLLDIAGHFGLSQSYTSTLFKECTGENFKEYLSQHRIRMAKEILKKEPNIKNNELARRIGCNTVATLFRLFNKYEGTSPGQYVKNLKLNG